MSIENYILKLREKHAQLEMKLNMELSFTWPNYRLITTLKHQKLKIKDEMRSLLAIPKLSGRFA